MSGSNPWGQATEFGVSEGTRELFEGVSRGGAGSTLGICREKGVGETEAWEEAGYLVNVLYYTTRIILSLRIEGLASFS